jgi:transcriptional regulator with XRE-family HTH domain
MRKNSSSDLVFAKRFGESLRSAYLRETKQRETKRLSVEAFASSLGLTRAGLHKAMKGRSVPSLELIEKARAYKVEIKYGDLPVPLVQRRARQRSLPEAQLYLPFAVDNLKKENVRVELGTHHRDTVELKVLIKFAG